MKRIVVADDIPDTLAMICDLAQEVSPDIEIVGRHTSLAQVQKSIDELKPDALLLDIQFIAEGKTAFDLLDENLRRGTPSFETIIITGHCETDYYDMAFRYKALHFIPKPIDKERLREALCRLQSPELPPMEEDTTPSFAKNRLIVSSAGLQHFIEHKKIVFLQTDKSGTSIHLSDDEILRSSYHLGHYEEQVANSPDFIRIHNNTIVNIQYVERALKCERKIILKSNFGSLKSSRERFKLFISRFTPFNK